MKKKSVFIFGNSGRMGREVRGIVEKTHCLSFLGGCSKRNKNTETSLSPDIVIDFSLPQALTDLKDFIEKHKSCLVSGTTGFNETEKKQLEKMGQTVPVFWSANMSFGIHLMIKLTESLAKYEKFYKYQIEEIHHIHKKDKPSGTALILEKTARQFTRLEPTVSRRQEDVFGIHRVIARSENEQLEICHQAFNRKLFARGAVDISIWLCEQPPGFYGMDDFLGNP